jgi:DNA mismatch endonuclease Vsr
MLLSPVPRLGAHNGPLFSVPIRRGPTLSLDPDRLSGFLIAHPLPWISDLPCLGRAIEGMMVDGVVPPNAVYCELFGLDQSMLLPTPQRSKQMSLIRAKGNKSTELALVQLLRSHRISGWRRHRRLITRDANGTRVAVRPDFVFSASRLAVFIDGCFWHGCVRHCRMPKSNTDF